MILLLKLVLTGGAIVGACGAALGPPLVSLLFAGKFAGIAMPLVILMTAVAFMAASGVLYQLILAGGFERALLAVTVVTTTLQAAANFWLIPRFGLSGAATGMLILVVATTIALSLVARKHALFSSQMLLRKFFFLAIFIAVTFALVYFSLPIGIAVLVGIAGLVFSSWWLLFEPGERDILKKQMRLLRTYVPFA